MSMILKGIDIPEKENRMYMMELYADGHCSVAKIENGECYELTIPSETEAIQIPKDHGKIVDLDDLVVKYWDGNYMEIDNEAYNNAVAILESEESNEFYIKRD